MPRTIDLTPTWGEWALLYKRLAESGESAAVRHLSPDFARMAASCEALKQISSTLTDEQQATVARVMAEELSKQGY
ncbi:hypothetical protein [Methyloversatilis sp.]|uniref:hypothetical protein n=1 Tax=Methyloversatilis sp. TaxID=2569862 RepID=UPI0035B27680